MPEPQSVLSSKWIYIGPTLLTVFILILIVIISWRKLKDYFGSFQKNDGKLDLSGLMEIVVRLVISWVFLSRIISAALEIFPSDLPILAKCAVVIVGVVGTLLQMQGLNNCIIDRIS